MRKNILFFASLFAAALPLAAQTFQPVYSFPSDTSKGKRPAATLCVGPDGQLYGAAVEGGANTYGTVFKISTDGVFTLLGSLDISTTGRNPWARLVLPGDGFLYGVTERNGGTSGDPAGTVFKVDPAGGLSVVFQLSGSGVSPKLARALVPTASNQLQVLGASPAGLWRVTTAGVGTNTYTFGSTAADGVFAYSMTLGGDGKLYGTTEGISYVGTDPGLRGTLFRINADGTGMTKLHDCLQGTGTSPHGGMVQATDGNFYGTMSAGGTRGYGTIFRLTPAGDYSVIYNFDSLSLPKGDLMQATDGFLYGTTRTGGNPNLGGVFRIKPDGTGYKTIHTFSGANGSNPEGGLAQGDDGNLYGTTYEGGSGGVGTIFRIKLDLPPPNRAPIASDDAAVSTGSAVAVSVLANDLDPEGAALTVTVETQPSSGTVEVLADKKIRYTPGNGFAGSDSFTYRITDPQGASDIATVRIAATLPPPVFSSTTYNGLLVLHPSLDGSGTTPRGQFLVTVSDSGKATGVLFARKKRISFRANFASNGIGAARVNVPGVGKAVLFLGFDNSSSDMSAILFGRELWSGGGSPLSQSGFSDKQLHTFGVGNLAPIGFTGTGYGLAVTIPSGLIAAVGKLPDGTKFSWGTSLTYQGVGNPRLIPVFAEPLLGGYLAGVLEESATPAIPYGGTIAWKRSSATKLTAPYASGFQGLADVGFFQFTPALTSGAVLNLGVDNSGTATISGGPLSAPVGGSFAALGSALKSTTPLKSLTINKKTGLVSGKMLVGKATVPFGGVVAQPQNDGFGFFRVGNASGAVSIAP